MNVYSYSVGLGCRMNVSCIGVRMFGMIMLRLSDGMCVYVSLRLE